MTVRNPLFEFMPYGAPELLAAQRPHLLRALALASSLALATFMLSRMLGLSVPIKPIELPFALSPHILIDNPPSIIDTRPPRLPAVIPTPPKGPAVPVPVDEVLDPPSVEATPIQGVRADDGFGGVTNPPAFPDGPIVSLEEPPLRGEWVYTDEMPAAVKIVKPVYPDLAREIGIEGRVYVHMLVGKDGRVMRAEVDDKIAIPMLNEAAVSAARQWVFKPAFAQRHPVMVWVGETFVFRLH